MWRMEWVLCRHRQVVSALASCRPVVTTAWLEAAVRCKEEGVALPSCHAHQPEVVDPSITGHGRSFSFQPNYSRTSLFTGKTFYFLCQSQVGGARWAGPDDFLDCGWEGLAGHWVECVGGAI